MKFLISKDETVPCATGENEIMLPSYLPISNPEGKLFSCESKLAEWHLKKQERDCLKGLYEDYDKGKVVPLRSYGI